MGISQARVMDLFEITLPMDISLSRGGGVGWGGVHAIVNETGSSKKDLKLVFTSTCYKSREHMGFYEVISWSMLAIGSSVSDSFGAE